MYIYIYIYDISSLRVKLQKPLLVSTLMFRIPSGSVSFLRLLAEFLSEFVLIFI